MISFHPDQLLSFWFGVNTDSQSSLAYPPPSDVAYIKTRMPLWFGKNDDFELKQKEIADTYLEIIAAWETYVAEEYQTIYEVWNTPKGFLGRIILFDQIPRCIFRATPRAFAYDSIAVKYALIIAEDENLWKVLTAIERLFVIVSIQHMEDMALQEKGVRLAYNIGEEESKEIQEYFKNLKGFPMEHHDVMKQFGRFPGRNQVLVSIFDILNSIALYNYNI